MKIGLIGAGNMATALARGLGEPVLVSDAVPERAEALAAEVGGRALHSNAKVAEEADVVLLCHKPAQLDEVAAEVAGAARAVASIVAATRLDALEAAYPGLPVYRFMPNLPVEVGRGVLCYSPGSRAAEGPEEELLQLLGRAGQVIRLEEPLLEPAMAVMACTPAFFALVSKSLADTGAKHGLARDDAARMVAATLGGTAAWLEAHRFDEDDLMRRVATPGGHTAKGLDELRKRGLPEALAAAVDTIVEGTRA